ncbi:MAG: carboxylating nicotinate-nucleotide diphosphorylase [Anaerolineae bacterium]|nr:carboxylating nicotinate-nucleotide diphosphorylase [Anaerolineae bacterium]
MLTLSYGWRNELLTQTDILLSQVEEVIQRALEEDVGDGDVTTLWTVPPGAILDGQLIAKQPGVVAGLEVARLTFEMIDERVQFIPKTTDGDSVTDGQTVAEVSGPGRALLSGERVALNLLQRMSGIATLTRRFVEAVEDTSAIILDTRKTVPGLRVLDKWAVRIGGGQNHRFGLYDMVLIKENHIAAAGGSISKAVSCVHAGNQCQLDIEVEVKSLAELQEALGLNIHRILLDNMTVGEIQGAVQLTNGLIPLEASGNITLENVAEVAATGVDYISVGALTHSTRALDFSLLLNKSYLGEHTCR